MLVPALSRYAQGVINKMIWGILKAATGLVCVSD
jgi:hypothetical protein